MKQIPATGFLRLADIIGAPKANPPTPAIIPVSKSTWWAGVKTGIYPKPVKIGLRATAWRVEDIRAFIEEASGATKKYDFKSVAAHALASVDNVLNHWLPEGKREGAEYVALNPTRSDNNARSFFVNRNTGVWSDFATGDKGGDLIALVAYINGTSNGAACKELAEWLGLDTGHSERGTGQCQQ